MYVVSTLSHVTASHFLQSDEISQQSKAAWFIVNTDLFYRPLASHYSGQTWILKDHPHWPQRFPLTSLPTLGSAQSHPTATWRRWTSPGEGWRKPRSELVPGLGSRSSPNDASLITQASESRCQTNTADLEDLEVVPEDSTALTCERPSDAHVDV